jgi:iron-sulfur cluster repair protein YtfE (RIC family)
MARRLAQTLSEDHVLLGQVLFDVIGSLKEADADRARSSFATLSRGLRQHIRVEDEYLFAAFDRRMGTISGGPTSEMKREHRQIERLLDQCAKAFEERPGPNLRPPRPGRHRSS